MNNIADTANRRNPQTARLQLFVVLVLLLSCLLLPPLAQAETAYGIIDQAESFYVADEANVLSADTETYIVEQNAVLEDLCGGQIVVATVDFLDGMDIEDYAYKLFADWEIGDADKNNGVLLLLAIGEEDYWCMQGKGLENNLTSGDIDDILWSYLEEDFAAGDYDRGVRSTFDALYDSVCAAYGLSGDVQGSDGYGDAAAPSGYSLFHLFVIGILVLVVIIVVVSIFVAIRAGRGMFTTGPATRPYRRRHVFIPRAPRAPRPPRGASPPRPPRPTFSARPKSTRASRPHSSFGGSHRGIGHGGGGRSRGGGAGRRH